MLGLTLPLPTIQSVFRATHKTCTKCGVAKPDSREYFYAGRGACIICHRQQTNALRKDPLTPEQRAAKTARDVEIREEKILKGFRKAVKADRAHRGVHMCFGCKTEFPATTDHFAWNHTLDAPRSRCYECRNKQQNEWVHNNPEKFRETAHRRRAKLACTVPQRWTRSECEDHLCYWCGIETYIDLPRDHPQKRELEHLMPISLGGEAKPYNEAWSCKDCNRGPGGKFDKHPLVWLAEQF